MNKFGALLAATFKSGCVDLTDDAAELVVQSYRELLHNDNMDMLRAVDGVFEDISSVIYYLRVMACTIIEVPELVQLFGLTGPVNCAKSFLVLLLAGALGQGPENLVTTLPANWLTSPMREDAESSVPVLSQCRGSKMLAPKEQLKKEMLPEKIKLLVAGPDVNVAARGNFSKDTDVNTFPVTRKVLAQSNSGLEYSFSAEDGLKGKIVEIQPPWEFVAAEQHDATNARQRVADPSLSTKAYKGLFAQELFAWARALACTLGSDICGGRVLSPQPPAVLSVADEVASVVQLKPSLLRMIGEKCTYVKPENARECCKLKEMFPHFDSSDWTAAGFGSSSGFKRQVRQHKKGKSFDYFYTKLPGFEERGAIGLKEAAGVARVTPAPSQLCRT